MTVLPIRLVGDPVLRAAAEPVPAGSERLESLLADMFETMDAVSGVGLAAPQIGVGLRVFTYDDHAGHRGHCVNPQIETLGSEPRAEEVREGCLSVPDISGVVERAERVRLTGVQSDGSAVDIVADGLLSTIFQHETDHLDGRLFVDRLRGEAKREAMRRLRSSAYSAAGRGLAEARSLQTSSAFGSGLAAQGSAFGLKGAGK